MATTNKKRGRPESVNGATASVRIRVTPEFKELLLSVRTQLDLSESALIIRAVNELRQRMELEQCKLLKNKFTL